MSVISMDVRWIIEILPKFIPPKILSPKFMAPKKWWVNFFLIDFWIDISRVSSIVRFCFASIGYIPRNEKMCENGIIKAQT